MKPLEPTTILTVFAIFCRVGGCLMIAPGFSSSYLPVRIRLFVALAVSLGLSPLLFDTVRPAVGDASPQATLALVASETAAGLLIGFVARLLFAALETTAGAINQAIGLAAIPGTLADDQEQTSPLNALFSVTAVTVMFALGLHRELLRGVVDSYASLPVGRGPGVRLALITVADQASAAFLVALRIAAPFILYSIVVNLALGITNKLTPQLPIYFIGTPFVMAGGLVLLLFSISEFVDYFGFAFTSWIAH